MDGMNPLRSSARANRNIPASQGSAVSFSKTRFQRESRIKNAARPANATLANIPPSQGFIFVDVAFLTGMAGWFDARIKIPVARFAMQANSNRDSFQRDGFVLVASEATIRKNASVARIGAWKRCFSRTDKYPNAARASAPSKCVARDFQSARSIVIDTLRSQPRTISPNPPSVANSGGRLFPRPPIKCGTIK